MDYNVLLGKMNRFETLHAAQEDRILTMLKTIEAQNLRIVTLEKQVEAMENEKNDQKDHISVLEQRVLNLEKNCAEPKIPENHNGHKVVVQNDQEENAVVSSNGTSVEEKRGKRITN